MERTNNAKSGAQHEKKNYAKRTLCIIIAILLMIGISAVVATIIHRNGGTVAASTNVKDGLSAYELAVLNGYDGSIQDWLNSLQGKSAYEIAKENGYTGSEEEWTKTLEATAGKDGISVKTAGFSKDGDLLITLSDGTVLNAGKAVGAKGADGTNGKDGTNGRDGANGVDGKNGVNGKDGADGKDGIGVSSAKVNDDGQLILGFSDGSQVNLDRVVGMNGKDGIGIEKTEITADGVLVITYTNGQTAELGNVIGASGKDGKDGIDGVDGKDGVDGAKGDKGDKGETGAAGKDGQNGTNGTDGISISSAVINESGELVLTYSDGQTANLGVIIGANGKDGKDGTDGVDGKDGVDGTNGTDGKDGSDGKDGISVSSAEINSDGELVLSFSNGQRSNLGSVIGAAGKDGKDGVDGTNGTDGKDGTNGTDGKNGISIIKSEINGKGELVITYSDNTMANLGVVVGANGKDGKDGIDGVNGTDGKDGADGTDGVGIASIVINENYELNVTLTNGTALNLGNIRGADGKNGKDGTNGTDGKDGTDGIGIQQTSVNEQGELVITYSNGESVNLGRIVGTDGKDGKDGTNGADGKDGVDGAKGEKGDKGDTGAAGAAGKDGENGISVAKTEINADGELVITYSDDTVKKRGKVVGKDGTDGAKGEKGDTGATGAAGTDGKDGIGISNVGINAGGELELSFSDGRSINLGRIVGQNGKDGVNGAKGDKGDTGATGANGKDGVNGTDGKDGIGIDKVEISKDGILSVTLTNGAVFNLGNIKGADGIGIAKSEINDNGELVLTYSDGQTANLGIIIGKNGTNGKDGIGISDVTILTDGTLTIKFSDGSTKSLGNIKGEKGDKGDTGATGAAGKDGRGIAKTELVNGELIITYTDGTSDNLGAISKSVEYLKFTYDANSNSYSVAVKDDYRDVVKNVVIPDEYNGVSVTKIGAQGFKDCPLLESVIMPDTITEIYPAPQDVHDKIKGTVDVFTIDGAFQNCPRLSKIKLSNHLNNLPAGLFLGCSSLQEITIPASVSIIGTYDSYYSTSFITDEQSVFSDDIVKVYFENVENWTRSYQTKPQYTWIKQSADVDSQSLSDPATAAALLKERAKNDKSYVYERND